MNIDIKVVPSDNPDEKDLFYVCVDGWYVYGPASIDEVGAIKLMLERHLLRYTASKNFTLPLSEDDAKRLVKVILDYLSRQQDIDPSP